MCDGRSKGLPKTFSTLSSDFVPIAKKRPFPICVHLDNLRFDTKLWKNKQHLQSMHSQSTFILTDTWVWRSRSKGEWWKRWRRRPLSRPSRSSGPCEASLRSLWKARSNLQRGKDFHRCQYPILLIRSPCFLQDLLLLLFLGLKFSGHLLRVITNRVICRKITCFIKIYGIHLQYLLSTNTVVLATFSSTPEIWSKTFCFIYLDWDERLNLLTLLPW